MHRPANNSSIMVNNPLTNLNFWLRRVRHRGCRSVLRDEKPSPICLRKRKRRTHRVVFRVTLVETVKDMSERVQFIFITHNKTTMELASQLIGVTMNEPGVSRLVAVDVDEAVRMAAM